MLFFCRFPPGLHFLHKKLDLPPPGPLHPTPPPPSRWHFHIPLPHIEHSTKKKKMSGGQTKAITILCLKRFLRVFNFPFLVFFPALQLSRFLVSEGYREMGGGVGRVGQLEEKRPRRSVERKRAALALVAFNEATLIVSVC